MTQGKQYSEEIFYTLLAIKILEEKFPDDGSKWKLVVYKAKKLLLKELNL